MVVLTSSLIDPALPLAPAERRRVQAQAWEQWMRSRRNRLMYWLGIAAAFLVFLLLPKGIDIALGYHRWYSTMAAFAIYILLLAGVVTLLRRYQFAPCVYAQLRLRGFDVCPRCGYWLRGLSSDVGACPECGAARTPMVSASAA